MEMSGGLGFDFERFGDRLDGDGVGGGLGKGVCVRDS